MLLPVKTAAVLSGKTLREVRRLISTKRVRLFRIGSHEFVLLEEVERA